MARLKTVKQKQASLTKQKKRNGWLTSRGKDLKSSTYWTTTGPKDSKKRGSAEFYGVSPTAMKKVVAIRNQLSVSQADFARIVGYSIRSIAGWESGKAIARSASQKLNESDRLGKALAEIIPANRVGAWLQTPNPAFEGQTPIQIIERGESDRIWRMITQIDASVAN